MLRSSMPRSTRPPTPPMTSKRVAAQLPFSLFQLYMEGRDVRSSHLFPPAQLRPPIGMTVAESLVDSRARRVQS